MTTQWKYAFIQWIKIDYLRLAISLPAYIKPLFGALLEVCLNMANINTPVMAQEPE